MIGLIRQRFRDDCTVCCIAMATGLSYERVLSTALTLDRGKMFGRAAGYRPGNGTLNALAVLTAVGVEAQAYQIGKGPYSVTPEVCRAMVLWRRRAIVSVPSRTGWTGWHDVYWTGEHVLDPGSNPCPDDLAALEPLDVILFPDSLKPRPHP